MLLLPAGAVLERGGPLGDGTLRLWAVSTAGLSRACSAMRALCASIFDLTPLPLHALQYQPGQGVHLVAGVFEHIGQHGFERGGALREDQTELAQQAADAVDASGAVGLEPCRPRHAAGMALRQAQTVLRTV